MARYLQQGLGRRVRAGGEGVAEQAGALKDVHTRSEGAAGRGRSRPGCCPAVAAW